MLIGHKHQDSLLMMMIIAFITTKSGLVPLIEGLSAQIYLRFEIIDGFAFTSCAFLFQKEEYVEGKISYSKISSCLLAYMCTLYTYTNTYMPRFSPSRLFGPSRCLIPTPGRTSEYPMCSMCVCVRIHKHAQWKLL